MAQAGYRDALGAHARRLAQSTIQDLNRRQPGRAQQLALRVGPLYANFARQSYDQPALDALWAYGQSLELPQAFRRLFDGAPVNLTEARPALHTALRSDLGRGPVAAAARAQVLAAEQRLAAIVAELEASSITDIVSIGIGGSDLGPRLVCDALKPLQGARFAVHFVSNIDGMAIERVLAGLDPARTAGILISKSFTTQETLFNGAILQRWLGDEGKWQRREQDRHTAGSSVEGAVLKHAACRHQHRNRRQPHGMACVVTRAAQSPLPLACSSSSAVQWLKVDQKRARIMPIQVALGSAAG